MRDLRDYFRMEVAYQVPGMEEVVVERNLVYRSVNGEALHADVYRPAHPGLSPLPVVIFVHGDAAPELLQDMKDSGQYVSWGRLAAASEMAAVTFNHRSSRRRIAMHEPASDVEALIRYVLDQSDILGVDPARLAIWVCSAGPPFVLPSVLRRELPFVRGVVVYYVLLNVQHLRADIPEQISDDVLTQFSPLYQLQTATGPIPPMLVVRAGHDHPRVNESIDRFVASALERNLALELINLPEAEHGFDVRSDSPEVRRIIVRTLEFLREVLAAAARPMSGEVVQG